jgi:hypothetical protein
MKTINLLIIYYLLLTVFGDAQTNHFNCTVFIDGKLPDLDVLTGHFVYSDPNMKSQTIDFEYVVGEITMSSYNYLIISKLDPNSDIEIILNYKPVPNKNYQYKETLKVGWLFERYLVLRITNLNSCQAKYYFGYSAPSITKKFIRKEYNMFNKE